MSTTLPITRGVNRVDLYTEGSWRQAMEFNRWGLGRIQGVAPETVELLPVSAKLGLDGGSGGIPALEKRRLELVEERGEEVSMEATVRRLLAVAGEPLSSFADHLDLANHCV
jgi:hypothetical protein